MWWICIYIIDNIVQDHIHTYVYIYTYIHFHTHINRSESNFAYFIHPRSRTIHRPRVTHRSVAPEMCALKKWHIELHAGQGHVWLGHANGESKWLNHQKKGMKWELMWCKNGMKPTVLEVFKSNIGWSAINVPVMEVASNTFGCWWATSSIFRNTWGQLAGTVDTNLVSRSEIQLWRLWEKLRQMRCTRSSSITCYHQSQHTYTHTRVIIIGFPVYPIFCTYKRNWRISAPIHSHPFLCKKQRPWKVLLLVLSADVGCTQCENFGAGVWQEISDGGFHQWVYLQMDGL